MHLIVVIQEDFPNSGAIDEFIKLISSKNYNATHLHSSWNRIRAREIRLFDFTIPECTEEQVLKDLCAYEGYGLAKLSKLLDNPLIAHLAKKLNVEKVKHPTVKEKRKLPVRIAIIGKYRDLHDEKGKELI